MDHAMPERDQYLDQVDRLCESAVLHSSESLCRLLRYLAQKELETPGIHVKEYQIATEVFGRPADFDPQVESTIRVQATRLRGKLTDYYASAGLSDPIVVELPKGSYSLQFRYRTPANGASKNQAAPEPPKHMAVPSRPSSAWLIAVALLSLVIMILAITLAIVARDKKTAQASLPLASEAATRAFHIFWQPFLKGPETPLVIFSNGAFVGRPETGMRYFDPHRDSKSQIWDHYTGVGEVLAIHDLDQVFGDLRQRIRVKRGSLFSLDDANNNDLIFVGSPSENLTLSALPCMKEFVFQRLSDGPRKGDLAIVNVHPRSDEAKAFIASPSGTPITEDYAVVALMPGLNPARSLMVLAGTTTFGTQAAVEFVSRRSSVESILSQLGASSPGDLKPFEAVVRVKIAMGVPVGMELAAVRKRS
jgi:hypothetical protein